MDPVPVTDPDRPQPPDPQVSADGAADPRVSADGAADPRVSAESGHALAAHEPGAPRLGRGEGRSPRDMTLSLVVLLVPIALLLTFYRVVLGGDSPVTVDPGPAIQQAQRAAAFTVAVPQALSDEWHVASAKFVRQADGATLRIGYVGPDDDGVQLIESSVAPDALLPVELGDAAKAVGNLRTPTGVWRVYDGRPGEKAVVLAEQSRTIVVLGRTDLENLQALATALR